MRSLLKDKARKTYVEIVRLIARLNCILMQFRFCCSPYFHKNNNNRINSVMPKP